jgi:glycosyltransferase involved in cell wall biosynthesis
MPSPAETFGMVTVEALAAGVPTVGFAALGTQELLQNGRYGLLAAPRNSQELANQVDVLWKDEAKREQLRQAGLHYAVTTYDKARFCEQWEALIGSLAPQTP